ncbi:MAG: UDP-glucuronate 4-epimerase [Alphaproteobacteria bacterium]|nr:UDP-glucuronate 4-epimerase [Alphaproteobacteria bacterium]
MRFLITGTAGFIGYHVASRLLADGHAVVGVDGITPYYDQALKRRRHANLARLPDFAAHELMLEDAPRLAECVAAAKADVAIHLAAQAGVRYSAENPRAYIDCNIIGTFNLLEALRAHPPRHLLLASTSSVYGTGPQPFEETQNTDRPISLYAATKKATEAMAYSFAHLHRLPVTAMRLFTVYGPWGRPDMALFKFTKSIIAGVPIEVYGAGKMTRDFTYVDDAVEAIVRLTGHAPAVGVPYRVVNVGGGRPIGLEDFIAIIEDAVGSTAIRRDLPMQPGDVPATFASTALLEQITGFRPATPVEDGVRAFVAWFRDYYGV